MWLYMQCNLRQWRRICKHTLMKKCQATLTTIHMERCKNNYNKKTGQRRNTLSRETCEKQIRENVFRSILKLPVKWIFSAFSAHPLPYTLPLVLSVLILETIHHQLSTFKCKYFVSHSLRKGNGQLPFSLKSLNGFPGWFQKSTTQNLIGHLNLTWLFYKLQVTFRCGKS